MLAALRSLAWGPRNGVLRALREEDERLWLRCCAELGPDEVLFSAMAVQDADDFGGAIPLPDVLVRLPATRPRSAGRSSAAARSPSPDSSSTEYVPVAERGWRGVPPTVDDEDVQPHRLAKKRRRLAREAAQRRVGSLGALVLQASGMGAVDRLWANAHLELSGSLGGGGSGSERVGAGA